MSSNKIEGVKRLLIAISVPWVAWWAYQLWQDYQNLRLSKFLASVPAQAATASTALAGYFEAQEKLQADILWSLGTPVALALAYWVYRGFQTNVGGNDHR